MGNTKSTTLTIRICPRMTKGLRTAAEQERHSLSNMIEVMIRHYCNQAGVRIAETCNRTKARQAG